MNKIKAQAARGGFEMFRTQTPRPSRVQINAALEAQGLPVVSKRMYDHYGRLARHGVDVYMPINEFDMAVKFGLFRKAS